MSSSIDKRIVEMQMDSGQFEKNAESAINTLKRLDSALKFEGSTSGLDNLSKSVNSFDLSKISSSVDALNNRFSAFGIAGMKVISDLTGAAENMAKSLYNNTIGQIISGGRTRAANIDQAKFKLEGLGQTWEKAYQDINFGVDQTSYGLDEAAQAAAQLVASGVEISDVFDANNPSAMGKALKGISGVAAMTSSSYSEIASIFTQTAGQGKLMTYQLRMLENRGMNAAAQMGKVLNKTEAEIREMVTKGQIDFQTFSNAMYQAFGEQATKANETFEGSLANMKAALSRIGAEFFTPFRSNMVDVFNVLRNLINTIGNAKTGKLVPIYQDFAELMGNISRIAVGILGNLDLSPLDWLIDKVHTAFGFVNGILETFSPAVQKVTEVAQKVTETTKSVVDTAEHVEEMANRVIFGEFGSGEERRQQLEALGESYEKIQNKVNEILGCDFRYEVAEEAVTDAVKDNTKAIVKNGKVLGKYVSVEGELYETTEKAKETVEEVKKSFDKPAVIEKFSQIIAGVSSAFNILGRTGLSVVKGAMGPVLDTLAYMGNGLLNVGGKLGSAITKIREYLESIDAFNKIEKASNVVFSAAGKVVKVAGNVMSTGFDLIGISLGKLGDVFTQVKGKLDIFWTSFKNTSGYKRLVELKDTFKDTFAGIKDSIKSFVKEKIQQYTDWDIKLPDFSASDFATKVSEAINFVLDKIEELKKALSNLPETAGNVWTAIEQTFYNVKSIFSTFDFGTIKDVGKSIKQMVFGYEVMADELDDSSGQVESSENVLSEGFNKVKEVANNLFSDIKEKGLPFFDSVLSYSGQITDVVKNLAAIGAFKTIGGSIKTLFTGVLAKNFTELTGSFAQIGTNSAELIKSFGKIGTSSSQVIDTFGENLPEAMKSTNKVIKNFAKGVPKMMKASSKVVTAFAKNLPKTMKSFNKVLGSGSTYLKALSREANAQAILNVAKAVGLLAAAFAALSFLSWENIAKGAVAIGAIALALGFLMGKINGMKQTNFSNPTSSLASVLDSISGAIRGFLSKVGLGALILSFGIAVGLIASAIKKLSDIPYDDAKKGALTVVEIVGILSVATIAVTKLGGKGSMGQALTLVALAGAIKMLASTVIKLGEIDGDKLRNGRNTIAAIGVVLAALMAVTKKMDKGGASKILALTFLIGAVAGVIEILSLMDSTKLQNTTRQLSLVIAALSALVFATSKLDGTKGVNANIALIGLLVIALGVMIAKLSSLDTASALKAAESISMVLGALSAAILAFGVSSKYLGGVKGTLSGMGSIGIITGVIGGIAMLIGALPPSVISGMQNLLSTGFPVLVQIAGGIGDVIGAFTGGVIGGIVGGTISSVFDELPGIGTSLSEFAENLKPFTESGFDTLVGSVEAVVDMLVLFGGATVITAIENIGSILNGFRSPLLTLGSKLNTFAGQMASYSDTISGVDTAAIDKTSAAISSVIAYARLAPYMTSGVFSFAKIFVGNNSLSNLGKELNAFASAMSTYSTTISGVDTSAIEASNAAAEMLVSLAQGVPDIHDGSVLSWIIGSNSLETLGNDLEPFGKGIKEYAEAVDGLDTSAVEASESAAKILVSLAGEMPDIKDKDSLIGWLTGYNDLKTLGDTLKPFAEGMVDYSKIVADLDMGAVEASQKAVEMFQAMQEAAPSIRDSGAAEFWLGDNSLSTLGENLKSFAGAIVDYADIISGVNFDSATQATESLRNLMENFSKFGTKEGVDEAGMRVATAIDWIKGIFSDFTISPEQIEAMNGFGEMVYTALVESIAGASEKVGDSMSGTNVISSLLDKLDSAESISGVEEKAKTLMEALFTAASNAVSEKKDGLNTEIVGVITEILTNSQDEISKSESQFVSVITAIGDAIVSTVESYNSTLSSTMSGICDNLVSIVSSYSGALVSAGKSMMDGMAVGITSGASGVINAMNSALQSTIDAGNAKLEINSPSHVYQRMGAGTMEGYALGITENEELGVRAIEHAAQSSVGVMARTLGTIGNQAEETSETIFKNLKSTYKAINTIIEEAMDVQPRITPVMDLTNIQSGVNSIGNILSGPGYTLGLSGLQYAQMMYPGSYQYGAEKVAANAQAGILSQIRGIRSDLNELGESISNMQMVLDSGALVGSIGGGMDQELGAIHKLKNRWA